MGDVRNVDVVVIGLGVGGEEAAGRLASAGLDVVGVEHTLVGGECPYWGCIPTKMMVRAGSALAEARRIPGLAGASTVEPDWAPVAGRVRDQATDDWNDKAAVDRLTGKGGTFVRGRATITGPGRVRVGEQEYAAARGLVLATGTVAVIPPIDGLAGTPYWTNRDAVEAATLPGSLIILGGGAIGCEFAQVFARFGVAVTIIEGSARILAMEEPESSEVATGVLTADGVTVKTGVRATHVTHDGAFTVALTDGSTVTGDRLLVATGRAARLGELGLETIGLDPGARFLTTDDRMRAADRVWAVGDVTGNGNFTHMAMYEADIAVRDILGQGGPGADYRARPRVTFLDPEIGAVGLTEQQARDTLIDVRVGHVPLSATSRGFVHGPGNEGFIKVVADHERGVLVGATTAGPAGGEMIGALAVAVHAEVPISTLHSQIWAYPTFHRGIGDALKALA
ncbi:pyruvate/2-oxoglutarate dehydrogenase complex dihydrolipoamide dehydrogenase (E3) component [Actinoplanes campanulatus]|uniref:Pyruvate/2-oxoglutarate dehydrogenase complex dihydrolipoamide dehydrogenase (E3) component n=1 Tax=Actinoplanes campanulatus TaxID=113559 RepID=A0A7W5ANQ1_9ACTN|nr:NAD(P)/FAD-dependent oxidoreductase [Actinoplanes campanulatus]MBB3099598.1 pyruvate/2-oxoglutarate dehydrogenase complex dihydrolipoamide dehydrogenase (E3) component [Actinoplanes campanulatus]GGN26305.1 pyridine nucleotide-disulfide oxidoreductase [Actinoplanes campanulatus]GID41490.1 pyridine nucleotide-disulfide oxidoreductase [Actinoplanes campanulatus]